MQTKNSIIIRYPGIFQLVVLLILFFTGINNLFCQNRWAFLVGISQYIEGSYWPNISSHNDIELLKGALKNRLYKEENIIILEDNEATKADIVSRFNKLVDLQMASGDQLFMHFSSHGQQRRDMNGDELDGLDECIVPFDSPMFYQENVYEGERLLSDDELQDLLKRARKKLGKKGHIFLSIDACHSGTSLRGYGVNSRGTDIIMSPRQYGSSEEKSSVSSLQDLELSSVKNPKDMAEICAFYGSSANQLNYEYVDKSGTSYGSLSYYLAKNLSQLNKNWSYRRLFEQISYEMALVVPRQQPEAEGNVDLSVLQGREMDNNLKYKIAEIQSDSTAVIDGGIFQGIQEGSIMNLYEDNNSAQIYIGFAKVISSQANRSLILFTTSSLRDKNSNSYLTLKEKNILPGFSTFNVKGEDQELIDQLKKNLQLHIYLRINEINPSIVYSIENIDAQKSKCYILNSQGQKIDSVVVYRENQIIKASDKLIQKTKNYLKAKYLKEIELKDNKIDVSFSIITNSSNSPASNKKRIIKPTLKETIKTLRVGQSFQLKLNNHGELTAYVCMLNIQSDHKVNILFPYGETTPYDFKIQPCQEIVIPIKYVAKNPKGLETLRLIASTKPIDFRSGFSTRSGSQDHPISILVDDTLFDQNLETRGAWPKLEASEEININTLQFKIID